MVYTHKLLAENEISVDKDWFVLLGERYTYKLLPNNYLYIFDSSQKVAKSLRCRSERRIKPLLLEFAREQISIIIQKYFDEYSQIMNLDKRWRWELKNSKSYWGRCVIRSSDPKKQFLIMFNERLYLIDEYFIKETVVHELLHAVGFIKHDKTFKKELVRYLPDLKEKIEAYYHPILSRTSKV
ncbi:SprT-like domain-containing protein [Mycoplasma sp. 1232]|uniref:SprT-like domain-containing protein n=1 Tax=Mycoplasma sp. 1232 TaxID=3108527 RepID=UPI002B257905|nr:SprT-like domain-containing protein [Mycoplasma sp. 1232]MEA4333858.1 YgjP-like metallopeptidase domain-containing protein [Mycoplasma sp. 1232]